MWQTIVSVWTIIKWVRKQKKEMEANVEAYLTEKRALAWRLQAEKMFHALSRGNGNLKKLPKPVRWFFRCTEADEVVGRFGMFFLKSRKMKIDDPVLDQPIYPSH